MTWTGFVRRLRRLLRRRALERELDEEMRLHLELEAQELARVHGASPVAARRQAHIAFGGVDRYKEEVRDRTGTRGVEDLARDVGYALRGLRRAPGFSLAAVMTLALGIGATAAIFSVVRGVLLRPLPYAQPEALVTVWSRFLPESGFDFPQFWVSAPEYHDYREANRSLSHLAAYNPTGVTLTAAGAEPLRVEGAQVSGEFFATLGVPALLGRTLAPADDPPGGTARVVLGHGLWRDRWGSDPGIVGRTIVIDGAGYEVVGVMPSGFAFPSEETALWGALGLDPAERDGRGNHSLQVVGRLASGVTLEQARVEMRGLMARWQESHPEIHTGHFLFMNALTDDVVGNVRGTLWILLGAACVVLLIACVNVANLMLARNEARRHELVVRGTLGAGRRRLIQQLLTDSMVLALAGGVVGTALAAFGVRVLLRLGADAIPRAESVAVDGVVLLFAFAVTLLTVLLFGLAPALRSGRQSPADVLRGAHRGGTAGVREMRLRAALIVAEVALAVVLVSGAGLMLRSFQALTSEDPGFRAEQVFVAQLALPARDYPDVPAVAAFHAALSARLAALPGVTAVSGATDLPLYETPPNVDFEVEGAPPVGEGQPARSGDLVFALPDYTTALGIRMAEGRFFTHADGPGAPYVAVVNRTAARTFWGDRTPLGARLRPLGSDGPWSTVVGVIDDVKWEGLDAEARPAYYMPVAQAPWRPSTIHYTLRTSADPMALAPAVRAAVRERDGRLPLIRVAAMDDVVTQSVARPRFVATLLAIFGSVALALGTIGIYGVLAYAVDRRRRELGIRMALGADRTGTAGLVLRQGMRLAGLGILIGLLAAMASTRLIAGLLYGVDPLDPLTLGLACAILLGAAALACWIPARRALGLDPSTVLRTE